MARYVYSVESQAAVPAGVPSGGSQVTLNGWILSIVGSSNTFKLRRVILGVRAGTGAPVSQQVTVGLHRQTVKAVGTGMTLNAAGLNLDPLAPSSAISGVDCATGPTAGTNGPTITATPLYRFAFNTQSMIDVPYEFLEEIVAAVSTTADGLALVNLDNALPSSHYLVATVEWEE